MFSLDEKHLTALKFVAKFDGSVAFVEKKPKLKASYKKLCHMYIVKNTQGKPTQI